MKLVFVTKRDIEMGKKNNCFYCPVALAVQRVTGETADVTTTKVNGVAALPARITTFIERFDAGLPVAPTTFFVDL